MAGVDCDEQSTRTCGEKFKECLKSPFPIDEHCTITGQHTSVGIFSIVGRESQSLTNYKRSSVHKNE